MIHASTKDHPLFTLCGKRTRDLPEEHMTVVLLHREDTQEIDCPPCIQRLGLELLKNDGS